MKEINNQPELPECLPWYSVYWTDAEKIEFYKSIIKQEKESKRTYYILLISCIISLFALIANLFI